MNTFCSVKRTFLLAGLAIVLSSPMSAQTQWTKYPGNPVMPRGPSGAWDDFVVIASRVIRIQDTLKMWYSGSRNGATFKIGYAWSTDGGISWTRHPSNPIMTPTQSWEGSSVNWPCVIFTGSGYKMWYSSSDIGYATSPDGIVWTKFAGNPVVRHGPSAWDAGAIGWPSVLGPDSAGGFRMWFEGVNGSSTSSQIGYATAVDETTWTKADSVNPVLMPVPGTWEPSHVRAPIVIDHGKAFQMWYAGGSGARPVGVGYATSSDGKEWTKDSSNPVLSPGSSGSWDASNVGMGAVLFDSTMYRMWYTGSAGTYAQIGYAAELVTSVRDVSGQTLRAYKLEQNYPNPFNPTTTLSFAIGHTSFVSLKVYDVLGEDVCTLMNGEIKPGHHEVIWDASGFASGVYYCRMQVRSLDPPAGGAGGFVETKRLILLR